MPHSKSQNLPATIEPTKTVQAQVVERGQQAIADIGRELRRPKPGAPTKRSEAIETEIFERLVAGESLTSITDDDRMPAWTTVCNWRRYDRDFDNLVKLGMATGQHAIVDIIQDIARGGRFSTGNVARDKLLIDAIVTVASRRNRADFGERVQIDQRQVVVNLPPELDGI